MALTTVDFLQNILLAMGFAALIQMSFLTYIPHEIWYRKLLVVVFASARVPPTQECRVGSTNRLDPEIWYTSLTTVAKGEYVVRYSHDDIVESITFGIYWVKLQWWRKLWGHQCMDEKAVETTAWIVEPWIVANSFGRYAGNSMIHSTITISLINSFC